MGSDKCNRCYRCNSFFITLTALISPIMLCDFLLLAEDIESAQTRISARKNKPLDK